MKKAVPAVVIIGLIVVALVFLGSRRVPHLRLATTTSMESSGLLAVILPDFEKANACKVDVIAVGTGKALRLGENGDVDVVLVHARDSEDKFLVDGHGVGRRDVMHNEFLIVGPQDDPCGLKNAKSPAEAFKMLASGGGPFVSRGDDSGTHKKEKHLWKLAGITPKGRWYLEAGQGMGAVLRMADEKNAYALTDCGTYYAYADRIALEIVFRGDKVLHNPYGIIAVNPKTHPNVEYELATKFIEYMTSARVQQHIANYRKNGKQLFRPAAVPQD